MGAQSHQSSRYIENEQLGGKAGVKYSICITNYNTEDTIRASISSILSQIDGSYEIVIVDNKSTDASPDIALEILKKAACRFTFVSDRCSRGRGRQLAFENSVGEYILSQIDMDDILLPGAIPATVSLFHKYYEGMFVLINGLSICPRTLIYKAGGWEDLQFREDRLLWWRMAQMGKLVVIPFKMRSYIGPPRASAGRRGLIKRVISAYGTFRDAFRVRQNLLLHIPMNPKWFAMVPLAIVAYVRSLSMKKFEQVPLTLDEWFNKYERLEHMPELTLLLRGSSDDQEISNSK
ncbi:MAG: glycosyltransferase family A protein [Conexivisphaerales archaeon]